MGTHPRTRTLSPRGLRRMLNFYPPWWFQKIKVEWIRDDFLACRVRVARAWRTRNLAGTTFGGTIYAAADPVYAVLLWQIFARRGRPVRAWLRAARARYLKPAATDLTMDFEIPPGDVEDAAATLDRDGRWSRWYTIEGKDESGETCATVETEVYLRALDASPGRRAARPGV